MRQEKGKILKASQHFVLQYESSDERDRERERDTMEEKGSKEKEGTHYAWNHPNLKRVHSSKIVEFIRIYITLSFFIRCSTEGKQGEDLMRGESRGWKKS